MAEPKDGDKDTCLLCQKDIYFWKKNPRGPGTWTHVREYSKEYTAAFGQSPRFCNEDKATPRGFYDAEKD